VGIEKSRQEGKIGARDVRKLLSTFLETATFDGNLIKQLGTILSNTPKIKKTLYTQKDVLTENKGDGAKNRIANYKLLEKNFLPESEGPVTDVKNTSSLKLNVKAAELESDIEAAISVLLKVKSVLKTKEIDGKLLYKAIADYYSSKLENTTDGLTAFIDLMAKLASQDKLKRSHFRKILARILETSLTPELKRNVIDILVTYELANSIERNIEEFKNVPQMSTIVNEAQKRIDKNENNIAGSCKAKVKGKS
jgi:hypothetical protein